MAHTKKFDKYMKYYTISSNINDHKLYTKT